VFCDLRGYTVFTKTAEPEEVLDFLREYHGALGPLVTSSGAHSTSSPATGSWYFSSAMGQDVP
jgi:class 3 adenylate cyclase